MIWAAVDSKRIFLSLFRYEFGVLKRRRIAEEVQKGFSQILMDGAQHLTVQLFEEGCLFFVPYWCWDIMDVCSGVDLLRVGQHFIPEQAAGTEGFSINSAICKKAD